MNKILTKGNQNEPGGPWRREKLRKMCLSTDSFVKGTATAKALLFC